MFSVSFSMQCGGDSGYVELLALWLFTGHTVNPPPVCVLSLSSYLFICLCMTPSVSLSPSLSSDTMNSALSLCRRSVAAGPGLRLLAGSPGLPAGAVRVCHSGPNRRSSVSTKKRGYDITRNPQLNKVRHSHLQVVKVHLRLQEPGAGALSLQP